VTVGGFLWLELVAALMLAAWVMVRYPNFGPRSIGWAIVCALAGATVPRIGLTVLPLVLRLPNGVELALLGVVLPVFAVMFLATGWLMRALARSLGGGRAEAIASAIRLARVCNSSTGWLELAARRT
jgi:hypothetical protein